MAVLVSKGITVPVLGKLLSDFTHGDIVKLNENGTPVEFYVAKHDYESGLNGAGRTLLVRKAICQLMVWSTESGNEYNGSTIDTWQNETYLPTLDENVQSAISETTFYYASDDANAVVALSKPVFLLSLTELGESSSYAEVEGSKLPTASILIPAVDNNGSDAGQWVRSAQLSSSTYVLRVAYNGTVARVNKGTDDTYGVRPCFTLPANAVFDEETLELLGVK